MNIIQEWKIEISKPSAANKTFLSPSNTIVLNLKEYEIQILFRYQSIKLLPRNKILLKNLCISFEMTTNLIPTKSKTCILA